MSDHFNPYHKWLGIPPEDQPANHYRLLGIELFESDPDVIESAADQRMNHLRTFQSGKRAKESQKLLNEVSQARICLLNDDKRARYDEALRARLASSVPPTIPPLGPTADAPPAPAFPDVTRMPGLPQSDPRQQEAHATVDDKQSPPPELDVEDHAVRSAPVRPIGRRANSHRTVFMLGVAGVLAAGFVVIMVAIVAGVFRGDSGKEIASSDPQGKDSSSSSSSTDGGQNSSNNANITTQQPGGSDNSNDNNSNDNNSNYNNSSNTSQTNGHSNSSTNSNTTQQQTIDTDTDHGTTQIGTDNGTNHPTDTTSQTDHGTSNQSSSNDDSSNNHSHTFNSTDTGNDTTGTGNSGSHSGRIPPPAREDIAELIDQVKESFSVDDAKTHEEYVSLARRMLSSGSAEGADIEERFAILDQAFEVAQLSGSADVARDIVDKIAAVFDVDTLQLCVNAIVGVSRNVRDEAEVGELIDYGYDACRDAILADRVDLSLEIVDAIVPVTQRTFGRGFQKEMADFRKVVEAINEVWQEYVAATDSSQSSSLDAEAKLIAGKWECFWKQDWDRGLPLLAECSDETLAEIARAELDVDGESTQACLALADKWWDAAEARERDEKVSWLHRSGYWYLRAMDAGHSLLSQQRIQQRLATIHRLNIFPVCTAPFPQFGGRFVKTVELEAIDLIDFQGGTVTAKAFSYDGMKLALASDRRTLHIFDLITGRELTSIADHPVVSLDLAFSRDDLQLVSADSDHKLRVYSVSDGSLLGELTGHKAGVNSVVYSPDNRTILSGCADGSVYAWTRLGQPPVRGFDAHKRRLTELDLSPDGKLLVTGSEVGEVIIWTSNRPRFVFDTARKPIHSVSFSADGNFVAGAGDDGNITIWSARNGKKVKDIRQHTNRVRAVDFFPIGPFLASMDRGSRLCVFNATLGETLFDEKVQGVFGAESVAVSPIGNLLVATGGGPVRTYRISYE